jgi:hypothetical protein
MRKRPLQTEPHGAIVRRRQLLSRGHERIGKALIREAKRRMLATTSRASTDSLS